MMPRLTFLKLKAHVHGLHGPEMLCFLPLWETSFCFACTSKSYVKTQKHCCSAICQSSSAFHRRGYHGPGCNWPLPPCQSFGCSKNAVISVFTGGQDDRTRMKWFPSRNGDHISFKATVLSLEIIMSNQYAMQMEYHEPSQVCTCQSCTSKLPCDWGELAAAEFLCV